MSEGLGLNLPSNRPAHLRAEIEPRGGYHVANVIADFGDGQCVVEHMFGPPAYTLDHLVADIRRKYKIEPTIKNKPTARDVRE